MDKSIHERVTDLTSKTLKIDRQKISLESDFANDLGADSLDQVELMMAFEAEFACEIPEEEAAKIRTVKDAVEYVTKSMAA